MTLVFYNDRANSVYVIESDEYASLGMYCCLEIYSKKFGWVYLGEL
jgi:hypothetical protein